MSVHFKHFKDETSQRAKGGDLASLTPLGPFSQTCVLNASLDLRHGNVTLWCKLMCFVTNSF